VAASTAPTLAERTQRYGLLLVAIAAAFVLQGTAEPGAGEQIASSALLGASLLLALRAADARPAVVWAAVALAGGVLIASIAEAANGNIDTGATRLLDALLVALTPAWIVLGVVRGLRARQAVSPQAVLGVLCVYLLLGMFFANVYGAVDRLGGSPFFAGHQAASVPNTIYFSFTTLTTTGYGDLTARSNLGHTLAVSEALVGQIYLVTVVALIVANLGRRRAA
jgi:hypothetical protein